MGIGAAATGCKVAKWKVAAAAVVDECGCCLTRSMGLAPSRDRLRGLLTAGTTADGSCCWLNIHRKYHDIAKAYCAGQRRQTPHTLAHSRKYNLHLEKYMYKRMFNTYTHTQKSRARKHNRTATNSQVIWVYARYLRDDQHEQW